MPRHPVRTLINKTTRRLHRWSAILIMIPLLVVIGSGILLQLKKEFAWIQPPTMQGQALPPSLTFNEILTIARTEPRAEIRGWDDVNRLDMQPKLGVVKVRSNNHWEVQIDTTTGNVLRTSYRRSDLIEAIHDGSFFHAKVKLWVFLPSGVILLALWLTGMYLWALPIVMKRHGKALRQHQRTHRMTHRETNP